MSGGGFILGELDAQNLQNLGLLDSSQKDGSKRIHRRRLNGSSENEYGDIPLHVDPNSSDGATAFATIPNTMISHETLSYVGLSAEKANEIWNKWINWPVTGPRREVDSDNGGLHVTFFDFITARLDGYQDVYEDIDDEWYQCLDICGISRSVQSAIMDPAFKTIRLSNSCIFWVRDTIEMRYAGLEDIRRASQQREMELLSATSRPGGPVGRDGRGGRGGTAQGGSAHGRVPSQGQRSVVSIQQQGSPGISSVLWDTTPQAVLDVINKTDHLVLFKGMDQGRITGLFNNQGEIQEIQKLSSPPPSDFSGNRTRFYFTPDHNIAEYYAAYAKRRAECESIVMICLYIRKEVIDELEEPQIQNLHWPSSQWKQLVWRSKKDASLPKPLRKYRDTLLIIGSIPKGANRMYENMQSWEEVTNSCLLRNDRSNVAIQYSFSSDEEGREFLEDHGTINAFSFSDAAVQRVMATYR